MHTTTATQTIPLQITNLFACEVKVAGIVYEVGLNLVWGSPSEAAPLTTGPYPLVRRTYKGTYTIRAIPLYKRSPLYKGNHQKLSNQPHVPTGSGFSACQQTEKLQLKRSQAKNSWAAGLAGIGWSPAVSKPGKPTEIVPAAVTGRRL